MKIEVKRVKWALKSYSEEERERILSTLPEEFIIDSKEVDLHEDTSEIHPFLDKWIPEHIGYDFIELSYSVIDSSNDSDRIREKKERRKIFRQQIFGELLGFIIIAAVVSAAVLLVRS